jgi:hypothetical protein
VLRRVALALLLLVGYATLGAAQIIPRLPGGRVQAAPQRRDTTGKPDSTKAKFLPLDSIGERLLRLAGYNATRYSGDTAFLNAETKSLDLLAAKKLPALVERDSQRVQSDSGIYYTQQNKHVTMGGNYIITPPQSSGQSEIKSTRPGRVDYDFQGRSIRVTNASLPVNNGETWYMTFKTARIDLDSADKKKQTVYLGSGDMTSCDDSIPDYTFVYKNAKRVGNTIVAAPVLFKIKDIPVAWLPFIFTDQRPGRHSGILSPQFGLSDIVRNSPSYRRNVDHVGYYWAPNEFYDLASWIDWRSGAGGTDFDPGWLRFNMDFNYKWLDRFMSGRIGAAYTNQYDGSDNKAVSWAHQEDFGRNNHLNTNVNFETNTAVHRENAMNAYTALGTIASQINYQSKIGPASLNIGATRKQYPGRQQIDQGIPSVSLTTSPIGNERFSWTPGFRFTRNDVLRMDQPGIGQYVYTLNANGGRDSALAKNRSQTTTNIGFDSPITLWGYQLGNSFTMNQSRNDYPQQFDIYDVVTGVKTDQRIYSATYRSDFDWTPTFTLPSLGHNALNLSPSVTLANVDPGPLFVASERTNGKYVSQTKRLSFGVSASPTLYGLFPGFGPFQRIRHSISPTVSWSYAPPSTVSNEYLAALGRTRAGYLGNLPQNQVTLGLNQTIEAKLGKKADTLTADADKLRLLSINFGSLTYDFERAKGRTSKLAGFTTDMWTYSLNSALLPGFDFSSTYSLFQGSTLSDTAVFKPYLTGVTASMNFSKDQNPFAIFSRLFGRAVPEPPKAGGTPTETVEPRPDQLIAQAMANQPIAGSSTGGGRYILPTTQGWRATFAFSRSSPRPPVGGDVINYDPQQRCLQQVGTADPILLATCLQQQLASPTSEIPVTSQTAGAQAYRIPPTTSLNSDIGFNLTPKWSAHWTTTYDVEHHEFASHMVQLQRDLHDWRAVFGFTQSPNGNFSFNFTIALKAEQDIKFDYNRNTVRSGVFQ